MFKEFFAGFDKNLFSLGIEGYGISITTLEEVFLRVGDGDDLGQHQQMKIKLRKQIEGVRESDEYDNDRMSLLKTKIGKKLMDSVLDEYSVTE